MELLRTAFEAAGLHFTQYGDWANLQILFVLLLPAVILALFRVRTRIYGIFASLVMIFLLIWVSGMGMRYFAIFFLFEAALIFIYRLIRKKTANKYIYFCFLFLSLCPMVISKITAALPMTVIGFLGLSYLNFKTIQVIIDLYDGTVTKVRPLTFIYFILFFPTLSSGPIGRYQQFESDITAKIPVKSYFGQYFPNGIRKIIMGIGYKFVLAYLINEYWLTTIPPGHGLATVFSHMYAYSFYLFFDFAGYSNFAVGASLILGVHTPENFNMPFASKDIKEFWQRWHISLSRWFNDYIYSRFVMNALKKKWFKSRYTAGYVGNILTMLIMGFWHGLALHYIVYGLFHGALLVGTDLYHRKSGFHKKHKNSAEACHKIPPCFFRGRGTPASRRLPASPWRAGPIPKA